MRLYDSPPPSHIVLPCGSIGHFNSMSYRCEDCMAVWGSAGCDCSNDLTKWTKEDAEKAKKDKS